MIATADLVRELTPEWLKADKPDTKKIGELCDAFDAVELRHVEGSGLRVTVKIGAIAKFIARAQKIMPTPNGDRKLVYRTTVASMQGRGIEINRADQFATILTRFFGAAVGP
ncbi:MAG TPA: hypothetical protein VHV55_21030 [Pirellulales bacterium]|nr:hypothetical protein [Pirellulales bacterium]